MRYVSTRGKAPAVGFEGALLAGLAPDGGLYVPQTWPRLTPTDIAGLAGLPYARLAERVLAPFVDEADRAALGPLLDAAYAGFAHPAVVPLKQLDANLWLLELFHGPTFAFKDVALQVLGRMLDAALRRRGEHLTIVGATSGDTGAAAIAACRGLASMDVVILHPKGRVSDVQRRQMTTVADANIHNVAVEGSFDDCQALVKAMFNDAPFRDAMRLGAVNSINWARVMAQAAYYVAAAVALGAPHRAVGFAVPTGNFGDVYAGYVAHRMGLPVARLLVATNTNDILARFLETGEYRLAGVTPTLSPSMDIQVASNFERLLFELHGRDGAAVDALMGSLARDGRFAVGANALAGAQGLFAGSRLDDAGMVEVIGSVFRATGEVVDPHTACGIHAARRAGLPPEVPVVALATAHPAKFPAAVARATGREPALPAPLAGLEARPERYTVLPNELGAVQAFVRASARAH